ncbi:MAG: hypothetical protein Kow0042_26040 [Calditrichia bacterium]
MQNRGLTVAGFLSEAEVMEGKKVRYWLHNIRTGEKRLLASINPEFVSELNVGQFHFDPGTFAYAGRILKASMNADALVIDEYGPLEVEGKGLREAFDFALQHFRGYLFVSVRKSLLSHLKQRIRMVSRKG